MNLYFYPLYFFIVAFLMVSCESQPFETEIDFTYKKSEISNIEGEVFFETDSLELPVELELVNEHLIISNLQGTHAVHIVDLLEKNYSKIGVLTAGAHNPFGNFGSGPLEFESIWSIRKMDENNFITFDFGRREVSRFNVINITGQKPEYLYEPIKIRPTLLDPDFLTDSTIVSNGLFENKKRICEVSVKSGEILECYGELIDENNQPAFMTQQLYQSRAKIHPDKSKMAVVNRYGDMLEIFDLRKKQRENTIKGPVGFGPIYKINESRTSVQFTKDTRFGYINLDTTNDYIIALFSGAKQSEDQNNYGDYVHVFDWNGNFIKAFRLSDKIIGLAYDEKSKSLFGTRHFPDVSIMKFDVSQIF